MKKALFIMTVAAAISACSDKVVSRAVEQCLIMEKGLSDDTMPRTFQDGKLQTAGLRWWCSGFYPGTCWYAFLLSGDEDVKQLAVRETAKLSDADRLSRDHDIGFQVMSSAGNAFRVTGDSSYLSVIRAGAEKLASRFSPTVGAIMSWDRSDLSFPVIIDNMMNLELLTTAARLFDVPEWKDIAIEHARTTMRNHFRLDGSSWHMVEYNPEDGSVVRKSTVQGYSDDSAWARGQVWGLYGFAMMYRETGVREFLQQAERIAAFLLPLLDGRPVPPWDFNAPSESASQADASAAAIMASACLELSHLTGNNAYRAQAKSILDELSSGNYLCGKGECAGFILRHGTGHYPAGSEVDVPLSYADYYFLEALYRYRLGF